MLATSDLVRPLVPLRSDTFHMFRAATLAHMKPGSFLINVCRGSVVDEEAVADAPESGHLAGYAADTFEMEDWARPDRPRTCCIREDARSSLRIWDEPSHPFAWRSSTPPLQLPAPAS